MSIARGGDNRIRFLNPIICESTEAVGAAQHLRKARRTSHELLRIYR